MLVITPEISIPHDKVEITAVRASGSGGQNVNKVASAVHLRLDIRESGLPEAIQTRLLKSRDRRITREGVIVLKAKEYRTFEKNRDAARERLIRLIRNAMVSVKKRKFTHVSRNARNRRMDSKTRRGRLKVLRKKVRTRDR